MSNKHKKFAVEDGNESDDASASEAGEVNEESSELSESENYQDGDPSDYSDDSNESGDDEGDIAPSTKKDKVAKDIPLWQRLQNMHRQEHILSSATRPPSESGTVVSLKKRKRPSSTPSLSEIMERSKAAKTANGSRQKIDLSRETPVSIAHKANPVKEGRKNKNAPAVMRSDRPVRRLRIDADNTARKFRDPRFSDASGQLNSDKFLEAYSFLDKYQEDEIGKIDKALKKTKNIDRRAELKSELFKRKQELTERRRSMKVKERLKAVKQEEKEKVAKGKNPYFLKRSAKKAIEMEERFDELKKQGKLNSFLNKKRKKNASKDRKWLPTRRDDE